MVDGNFFAIEEFMQQITWSGNPKKKKNNKITLSGLFQLLVKENLEKAELQLKPFGFESGMT